MANEDRLRDYLKLATANLRQARQRLREMEERSQEPIAIVGMSCRYPGGVRDPEELWELLANGGDAISGFPADRGWDVEGLYHPDPDHPGTSYTRQGGFVHGAAEFDPGFFGISPREALAMDPQQRMLLEVSWEAFERAGIDPRELRGSPTGVFAGAFSSGYGVGLPVEAEGAEGHLLTGTATSVLSGRVAFTFGLEGPAVTVDTACSSALMALHLACQALRAGDCSLALAGGVTIMVTPGVFVGFSRQRGMSADGRCKSFAASADGSGWAEGAGVVVVERLSDARRNGHQVLAVVAGIAVNQDGASNGLTAPNGPSQQRVIRAALAAAGLRPDEVDAVEAHGSGTTLGDPIEAQALLATYGQDRPGDRPLWLGSVKSNIGHPQAAAGVAGVIKMVLALRHQVLPRTLHAQEPTPHVDWSSGAVRLLTEPVDWPANGHPRRAGVSAFGIGGTNVHVILEEAPAADNGVVAGEVVPAGELPGPVPVVSGAVAWVVSGRTAAGLAGQAGRLAGFVAARPGLDPADVGWSLAATRSVFEHRAVVTGAAGGELAAGLAAVAAGVPGPGVVSGFAGAGGGGRVVFVFPGQGSQWAGMGAELAGCCPVFAARLAECGAALAPYVDWSLAEVLAGAAGAPGLDAAEVVQPVLWAVMVSLAAVWEAAGVVPDAVVGHSQGEIAAACVAGILTLEDGARVVAVRSRALSGLGAAGGMVSVVMPEAAVRELLARWDGRLAVAAVNGPAATVVSGDPGALAEFGAELSARHVMRWPVPATDFVAHSARVEELAGVLAGELDEIVPVPGRVPLFSTVHARWMDGPDLDAGYWYANLRQTVRFADAVTALSGSGYRTFIEVSPHPVLTASVTETVTDAAAGGGDGAVVVTGTLERELPAAGQMLAALARVHVTGTGVDWAAVAGRGTRVDLPTYAFERQRYWPQAPRAAVAAGPAADGTGTEARFWAAVDDGDLGELAGGLPAADRQRLGEALPALSAWRRREHDRSAVAGWRYKVAWAPVTDPGLAVLAGTWLVVVPAGMTGQGSLADRCARALAARGAAVAVAEVAAPDAGRAALAARVTAALADARTRHNGSPAHDNGAVEGSGSSPAAVAAGVVSLLALDEGPAAGFPAVAAGLAGTQALVQALGDAGVAAPLWVLTCGAVAAVPGEVVTAGGAVQAQAWGMGRVTGLEHPERWGGLIDVPPVLDERSAGRVCAVLAGCGEDQVAVRAAGIMARRLVRAPRSPGGGGPWAPGGTVLVTGGTGAIGGHVARWAAGRGAPRIILASRSGPAAPAGPAVAARIAAAGTPVQVIACDVADRAQAAALLHRIAATGPALTSVMHTAGIVQATTLHETTTAELAKVLGAKARGAAHLDELTAGAALDAFVLFSSIAATWGSGQQPAYAAANAFLDALAASRQARGLPATSVAWGPWDGGGMTDPDAAQQLARRGLPVMDPALLLQALGQAIDSGEGPVTIADVDWARFAPPFTLRRPSPLIEHLPEVTQALADADVADAGTGTGAPGTGTDLGQQLAGQPQAGQDQILTTLVRAEAATVLGHPAPDAVDITRAFSELGFDSLTAVELRNRLSTATGLRLPATLLFDYPTPAVLAGFLRSQLAGGPDGTPVATSTAVAVDEPVAIVGMSCRYPGGVRSPEELWELLATGGDAVSGLPADRSWDIEELYDPDPDHAGTSYVRGGGFVHDAGDFDAGFFGISPREALAMDPQQRMLLEVSWEAFERTGIAPESLRGSRTGVFVGASASGYGFGEELPPELEGYLLTGTAASVMSGRVSYALGLEGPAVTVDTACSSALVALHLACQALRAGECGLAVAGGVTVMATSAGLVGFSRQRGLAADGRCKAFSAAADGMGLAEGAGMVVLERLSDARRNGHPVLAVVAGSAVNQDGASNGLTAPNGPSQQRVIRAALAAAGLRPDEVDAVEAHGTGTTLGDPIEAQALLATYGQDRPESLAESRPLWLGSVKSNIGHPQAAAGVAGVIKMVLALQHQVLPRTLHAQEPTPHVDWSSGAVRLLTEPVDWRCEGRPRRAGVSAFGMSGTNVHVILEEAPAADDGVVAGEVVPAGELAARVPVVSGAVSWVVSGRTAAGLAGQAGRLAALLTARPGLDPADVGWSLATTRSAFEHRAVITGTSREELAAGLVAVAAGRTAAGVMAGSAGAGDTGRVVFVFPGQGSQWAGMGAELAGCCPVFAARLAECGAALAPYVDWSLADVLAGAAGAPGLDAAEVVQPVLWAVMVSLAAVWEAAGVVPDAVVGHSQGEIAAACVAGILTLEDGARVVAVRSRALSGLGAAGGMVSVVMPEAAVRELLARWDGRLAVAAVNGPAATVVSGDPGALAEFGAELSARHVMRWPVPATDFVAHSARVEELAGVLAGELDEIVPVRGRVPLFSTVHARWMDGPDLDAGYWYANLRQTVRFRDAVEALSADGYRTFIEVSPHPTLEASIADTIEDSGVGTVPVISGTLHRESSGAVQILTALARVHVRGGPVDWAAVLGNGRLVDLPTYAFQRQRFWPQLVPGAAGNGASASRAGGGSLANEEAGFWAAVEGGDVAGLAGTLAVDEGRLAGVVPALSSWRRRERDRSAVAGWRYKVAWVPVTDPGPAVLAGTWLVVVPGGMAGGGSVADGCVRALAARGARVLVAEAGPGETGREVLAARICGAVAAGADGGGAGLAVAGVAGVVSLLALDEGPVAGFAVVAGGLAGTAGLVQALGDAGVGAPLWVLTCGAVGAVPGEAPASVVQAQAWGLGRVTGLEYPERWGGLIDVPAVLDERSAGRVCAVLAGCGEDQVAVRAAGILARRLVRAPASGAGAGWVPGGTVLVTGGTGAIGGQVARWAAGRGAARVVLASRSGPSAAGAAGLAAGLAGAGAGALVVACDAGVRDAVAGLVGRIAAAGPPLSSVMHAAGVIDDGLVDGLDPERLAGVLAAKAGGAAFLDELTAGLDLDAFVLFSSAAATFGGAGQGNYAAANAFLDALAEQRAGAGRAGLSVAWGPWAGGGVAGASEAVRARLRRGPLTEMDPVLALRALGQALDGPDSLVAVMDVDWAQFAAVPGAAQVPFIRDLPEIRDHVLADPPPGAAAAGPGAGGELAGRLAGAGRAEQDRILVEVIRAGAAAVLGHGSAEAIDPGRPFADLGFDSLTTLEMRQQMSAAAGLRLPATLLFDYPTPLDLAGHLRAELLGDAAAAVVPAPAAPPARAGARTADPVAIVAMSCRYPGGVTSPESLWDLLAAGTDAISGFPADRGWDLEDLYDPDPDHAGTSYVRAGGFVHDAGEFDPGFFSISPREALAMDPQQRLLLEISWEALERAGIDPRTLRGTPTGVFAGGYSSGYVADPQPIFEGTGALAGQGLEGHLVTGNATSVISGRVSYVLGLEGPAVTVDTACSSSLVTLHLACQALRAGECDLALAGGVTIMAKPAWFGFSRERQPGQAADGRCKAFSADADGMGMAEGAGVLVVERLSDARRNGHPVLAVVAGIAVNQDGASNGLTAPNGPSQQRVIRAALASAGLSAGDVDVVEAHGTGTELGDPIEAQALLATYGQDRPQDQPLWLGSVKSNIGHPQAAAGVAGVIKMVQALQHQILPRTLHAQEPSPHVDWSSGAVRLLTEPVDWRSDGRPRRAGVSAFGMSGTNVHVILEESPAAGGRADGDGRADSDGALIAAEGAELSSASVPVVSGAVAWVVSGRTAAGLAGQAGRLAGFVAARPGLDPADVGWSLAATRSVFEHRAVVTGAAGGELAAGLAAVAAGVPGPGVVSGFAGAGGGGRVVFVFPGQGSQWAGMGAELAGCCPVFAARLAECGAALAPYVDWSLAEVLAGAAGAPGLDAAEVVQPVLWAVMVSLAAVWEAAGVVPDAVVGHSQGEIAAACVAGILTLEDGARVVAVRSRALSGLGAAGGMVSVVMPEAAVRELLARWDGRLAVAAVNGPAATVVSGDPGALAEFGAELSARHVMRWPVPATDFVAHSARVEELAGVLAAGLDEIVPVPGRVPLFSTVHARWMDGPDLDAGYWYANLRQTVRFADAVTALSGSGYRTFIEVSPHPVLTASVTETVTDAAAGGGDGAVVVTGTLERELPAAGQMLAALARVHVTGTGVDWAAVAGRGRRVDLPTYAFERQRYWPQAPRAAVAAGPAADGTGTEARFWAAVDDGDLGELAGGLPAADRQRLGEALPVLSAWRRREHDRSAVAGWRYKVAWAPVTDPGLAVLAGTWLVVVPAGMTGRGSLADRCARALAARGAAVVVAEVAAPDAGRAALAARVTAALADARTRHNGSPAHDNGAVEGSGSSPAAAGVVSLLALDEGPAAGFPAVAAGLAGTQALVQALGDAGVAAPLWVLTCGAVAAVPGEVVTAGGAVQAQAWGMGRVTGLEHPERWGGLIDVPPVLDERSAGRVCAVLAGCGEDQVAVRAAGIMARRLVRAPRSPGGGGPWAPGGTVLVTGGTGAIGGHVARWAAGRGAPRIILASRSGPAAPAAAAVAARIAAAGTPVQVIACDVADRAQAAALLHRIAATGPALTSVMHTAGIVQATTLHETTTAELAKVLGAKARGAAHLDELTAGAALDAFVLFSSIAATWGSGQQPAYAAANAFLDALAASRQARGLPATSVAWGPWDGGGMTDPDAAQQLARRGLPVMDPALLLQALGQAIDSGEGPVTIADVDWARFAPPFTLRRPSPLIEHLPEVTQALADADVADAGTGTGAPGTGTDLGQQLAGQPQAGQDQILTTLVRAEAATVLGHPAPDAVDITRAFSELGFDSLTAVELRNRLSTATGLRLPATLLFDYPTPAVLAGHLRGAITPDEAAAQLPVLAELDKLESTLSAMDADDIDSSKITARLETVIAKWKEAIAQVDRITVAEELESSTDDEVFDFIGKELGIF